MLTFYENDVCDDCNCMTGIMRKKPFIIATNCPITAIGRSIFYIPFLKILFLSKCVLSIYINHRIKYEKIRSTKFSILAQIKSELIPNY